MYDSHVIRHILTELCFTADSKSIVDGNVDVITKKSDGTSIGQQLAINESINVPVHKK